MKRKLLICCSLITLLLSVFSIPIYADEDIEDIEELAQVNLPDYALDQYFYDNYVLLPYIYADNKQWINTSIPLKSNYKFNLICSDISTYDGINGYIFGARKGAREYDFSLWISNLNDGLKLYFYNSDQSYSTNILPYSLYNFVVDKSTVYLNGNQIINLNYSSFSFNSEFSLYTSRHELNTPTSYFTSYKLYKFSCWDYDLNDGLGGYVRYYYPAKSKSSGIIGLYDSINKTFVTTASSIPFSSPIDDQVISFQISDFLDASMDWIEAIFLAIIDMPIIIVFMAIGLAGAMFRWGRRIVHF